MYNFEYLKDMVVELRATSSSKDKENIIKEYCGKNNNDSRFVSNVLHYTYHPTWQYFVTSENLKKKSALNGRNYEDFFILLDDLKNRKITGHDAIGAVNSFVSKFKKYEELIHCVIDKDLKTRASDKIINKAVPDLIPEFSVSLADKYEPKIVDWKDDWYVSTKIDGVRCICVVSGSGDIVFYSRTGKTFETLSVINNSIKNLDINDVVFDGELCLLDEHGNEDFQGIMKEIRKKDHTIKNPSFKIFDMISVDEFWSKKGKDNKPYSVRYANLLEVMKNNSSKCLSVLNQDKIKNDDHFQEWIVKANEYGWEGLMLRANVPYKGKRSKDLLKYKSFFDDEYRVVDVEMGPFRYVLNGKEHEEVMLSCVKINHKGHSVKVGSGFSIDQRKEFYKNPENIVGKIIQVQYFSESSNQDGGISLRFPTFKYLYGDSRET